MRKPDAKTQTETVREGREAAMQLAIIGETLQSREEALILKLINAWKEESCSIEIACGVAGGLEALRSLKSHLETTKRKGESAARKEFTT